MILTFEMVDCVKQTALFSVGRSLPILQRRDYNKKLNKRIIFLPDGLQAGTMACSCHCT